MSRICEYSIHILPNDAIQEFENPTKRQKGFLKIKGGTFLNVPDDLRIRPRAAHFTKKVKSKFPTFVVIYDNGEVKDCLFVFKFLKYADTREYFFQLTRCIGSRTTKRRKEIVADMIWENKKFLLDCKHQIDSHHSFIVEE